MIKKLNSNPTTCSAHANKGKIHGCSSLTQQMETHLKITICKHPLKIAKNDLLPLEAEMYL